MIIYWLLLLPTAFVAYFLGSMSSLTIASSFVFHSNLRRLGKGDLFISNFRRIYGVGGIIKLLLVEVIRDVLPILLGSLLLGFKGHAEEGRLFAGFCLVLGQLYPMMYDFKGSSATIAMLIVCLFVDTSLAVAVIVFTLIALVLARRVSLATIVGAVSMLGLAFILVNGDINTKLTAYTALIILIYHIPSFIRLLQHKEAPFSLKEDLSYKFDK